MRARHRPRSTPAQPATRRLQPDACHPTPATRRACLSRTCMRAQPATPCGLQPNLQPEQARRPRSTCSMRTSPPRAAATWPVRRRRFRGRVRDGLKMMVRLRVRVRVRVRSRSGSRGRVGVQSEPKPNPKVRTSPWPTSASCPTCTRCATPAARTCSRRGPASTRGSSAAARAPPGRRSLRCRRVRERGRRVQSAALLYKTRWLARATPIAT